MPRTTSDPLQTALSFSGKQQGMKTGIPELDVMSAAASTAGSLMNLSALNNKTVSQSQLATRNQISDLLVNTPGAVGLGLGLKAVDLFGDLTGLHLDEVSPESAKNAGVSKFGRNANYYINAIPGLSTLGSIFSSKTNRFSAGLNDYGRSSVASYSSVMDNYNDAKNLANKRTLFGVDEMNKFINTTADDILTVNQIGKVNTLAKKNDYSGNIAQQTLNRYAGTNYQTHAIGRKGMKMPSREELQAILAKRKFQNGGVIGVDTNILPEGALHARLNHLQDTNPDLEDTTRKGIPVLDESGQQVAEIEHSELILRLEITKKIEELMKDGSEEAMIEAGKILVDEIIDNTQDNTGKIIEDGE